MSGGKITVERDRVFNGHHIFIDGKRFGGTYYDPYTGIRAAERHLRNAARQKRKCITGCGREFMSEGPHHRMCDPCRRGGGVDVSPSRVMPK